MTGEKAEEKAQDRRPHVVVIGAGFAGLAAAAVQAGKYAGRVIHARGARLMTAPKDKRADV